jgi:RNA binding exosome subunit
VLIKRSVSVKLHPTENTKKIRGALPLRAGGILSEAGSLDVCVRRNQVSKLFENQIYVLNKIFGEETSLHEDVERQIESLEVLDKFPHGSERAKVQLQNVYLQK